jgi:hypothetical protein
MSSSLIRQDFCPYAPRDPSLAALLAETIVSRGPNAQAWPRPRPGPDMHHGQAHGSPRRRQLVTSVGREGVEDLRRFDDERCGKTGNDVT